MITQAEIASRVGISKIAVSYALRGSKKVSAETRRRVEKAAEELGYRANAGARAIRTGRFGSIALLLARHKFVSNLPSALLAGIESTVSESDYNLLLARLPDEQLTREGFLPKLLREQAADGLLINYTYKIPPKMIRLIRRYDLPAVWINSKQPADCVYPDDADAAERATAHLIARGHRRIAYIDYAYPADQLRDAHYSARDREAGYLSAMKQAGLRATVLRPADDRAKSEEPAVLMRLLKSKDRPTGFVSQSAAGLPRLFVIAAGLGLAAPRDLAAVTFAENAGQIYGAPTTVMVIGNPEIGTRAVQMLLTKLASNAPQAPIAVRHTLVDPLADGGQ
jgi:LacI family transcriptional regulator